MNTATGRASFVFASALIAGALLAVGPAANQAQSGTVSAQQARPDVMTSDYVGQEDDLFADAFKRPGGSILSEIEDEAVFSEEPEAEPSQIPAPGSGWMLISALLCFALAGWRAAALRRS